MSKQTFVANTILTASQMNTLQANDYNQTVSTKTASYTLVATDAGTRVVMNVASANTVTVNTSLFTAGDTLVIQNIGAGVTTVTAGTATVSSAGPLTIAQYGSGTLYFTSAGVSLWFPSAGPAASSGLTYITSAQVTSSSSSAHTNVFSATYDNYLLIIENATASVAGYALRAQFGTGSADTAADYIVGSNGDACSATTYIEFILPGATSATSRGGTFDILSPNLATATGFVGITSGGYNTTNPGRTTQASKNTTVQYTSLHFLSESPQNHTFKFTLFGYAIS